MGFSNPGAAGTSGAGGGSTALATTGATGSGFGTSALAGSRIGRGGAGGAEGRGATRGADGNFTSAVAGMTNTPMDRGRGVEGASDARIGTTIRTRATMACNTTLSHRPVVQRPGGGVLNRASSNRIDMCRTELKCRSVLLQRRCCFGEVLQQGKCREIGENRRRQHRGAGGRRLEVSTCARLRRPPGWRTGLRARAVGGSVRARPPLEAVSLSSSSGMVHTFAAPLLRAQPVRSPVLPQSARAACSAFSPDVGADVRRLGDGSHS
jgi:hypothetical protein